MEQSDLKEEIRGLIVFKIGKIEYCYNLSDIVTIIKLSDARIEKNRIEYKGIYFPLVDLKTIFSSPNNNQTKKSRILLVTIDDNAFAFFVDDIIEVLTLDKKFIDSHIQVLSTKTSDFIKGELKYNHRSLIIPNFKKIYERRQSNYA